MENFMKKTLAFTLAETLIVMGVIGIVAALTIPNLNQATADREKVTRVKKMYANLEDALGRTEAIYGPLSEWTTANLTGGVLSGRMIEFMKHSKECAAGNPVGCFTANNVAQYSGSNTTAIATNSGSFVTADGSSVGIVGSEDLTVYVDIDGPNKGENKLGKDVFQFYLNKPEYLLTPAGRGSYASDVTACTTNSNCTGWVVDYDNLDYTKCTGLNATNKTSCK